MTDQRVDISLHDIAMRGHARDLWESIASLARSGDIKLVKVRCNGTKGLEEEGDSQVWPDLRRSDQKAMNEAR
jgi:hypothetical protein